MDLSVILVNWNSLDYLRPCLASIYKQVQGLSFEVIVVDNASTKDDLDTLQPEFPNAIMIKSAANLGFAGANNLGYKRSTGDYLLLLNPDTEILGDAIQVLVREAQKRPRAGIVGGKL